MVEQIIKSVIGYVIPALLGFFIAKVTSYKKKNDSLKQAIMTMLQSNISNTYFLYDEVKAIPDYLYRNTLNEFKAYKQLGGNEYVDNIMDKMQHWEIARTDILHKEK